MPPLGAEELDSSATEAENCCNRVQQFETEIRRERQMEGIAKAKGAGKYKGRKPLPITTDEVRELRDFGLGPSAIARKLRISRASVYRLLEPKPR